MISWLSQEIYLLAAQLASGINTTLWEHELWVSRWGSTSKKGERPMFDFCSTWYLPGFKASKLWRQYAPPRQLLLKDETETRWQVFFSCQFFHQLSRAQSDFIIFWSAGLKMSSALSLQPMASAFFSDCCAANALEAEPLRFGGWLQLALSSCGRWR